MRPIVLPFYENIIVQFLIGVGEDGEEGEGERGRNDRRKGETGGWQSTRKFITANRLRLRHNSPPAGDALKRTHICGDCFLVAVLKY